MCIYVYVYMYMYICICMYISIYIYILQEILYGLWLMKRLQTSNNSLVISSKWKTIFQSKGCWCYFNGSHKAFNALNYDLFLDLFLAKFAANFLAKFKAYGFKKQE